MMLRRLSMFDFGIEKATKFQEIAYYGPLWLVEFSDYEMCIVIEDERDSPDANYIIEEDRDNHE
jgi:hypothetical protein